MSKVELLSVDHSMTFYLYQDLISELKSELSGGLKKLCVGLCMSAAEFDAMNLNNAIKVSYSFHYVSYMYF